MKHLVIAMILILGVMELKAQDQDEKQGGFRKENLFTGGGLSFSLGSYSFLIGVNPVLGYRIADWVDAGIAINYQYSSLRDYYSGDKQRQNFYGGGVFTRLFPVPFVFAQAQFEHNFINQKYIVGTGGDTYNLSTSANSFLIGLGYMQGRMRGFNSPGYYISVLWDVSGNTYSPYTDLGGRSVPIIRAGVNVPLFRNRGM